MLRNLRQCFVYQQNNKHINAFDVFPETTYAYNMQTKELIVDGKTITGVIAVELVEKASSVDDAIRQSSIYKFSIAEIYSGHFSFWIYDTDGNEVQADITEPVTLGVDEAAREKIAMALTNNYPVVHLSSKGGKRF